MSKNYCSNAGAYMPQLHNLKLIGKALSLALFSLLLLIAANVNVRGQLDTSFAPNPNGEVRVIEIQPDGKKLFGGYFATFAGQPYIAIARMNTDDTLDTTFSSPLPSGSHVRSIAIQADGKILIGGIFPNSGMLPTRLRRLNANGTIDNSFNPDPSGIVHSIKIQPDGKILVGGAFEYFGTYQNNIRRPYIARLNADGTVDSDFNPRGNATYAYHSGDGAESGGVQQIELQSNGGIIIAGNFSYVWTRPDHTQYGLGHFVRIQPDGTFDFSFTVNFTDEEGNPATGHYFALAPQPDGKFLAGGSGFRYINGVPRRNIVRLNADFSVDETFNAEFPEIANNVTIREITVQSDGKILVGGQFVNIGGQPRNGIARLNPNGTADSFDHPTPGAVRTIKLQSDDRILVGGIFNTVSGQPRTHLARFDNQQFNRNGKIVFSSDRNGNSEIFTMNNDGTGVIRLTNSTAFDYHPSFSPDGSKIVFISNRDNSNYEIYTMNADGSGLTRLTNDTVFDRSPSFSPDGTRIVFRSGRDTQFGEIYTINSGDGGGATRITTNNFIEENPSFSPDGYKILFTSHRNGNGEIYTINSSDGSAETNLTNNTSSDAEASFSPDGSRIVFTSNRDGNYEIYTMNIGGGGLTRLTATNSPANEFSPWFSPDGSKIVFGIGSDATPGVNIYTMNADGSGTLNLTNSTASNGGAKWQPVSFYTTSTTPTQTGQNVTVVPVNNLNMTFSSITTDGITSVTVLSQSQLPQLPANFSLTNNPIMYNITTLAGFTGNITVTFDVPNVAGELVCSQLRILHYTNNNWDLSGNSNPVYNSQTKVCRVSQIVSSLSPFVVARYTGATSSISGQVTYGITPIGQTAKIVSEVLLNPTGAGAASSVTSSTGAYLLDNLIADGSYTVTPSKSGNINGISPFDATLVLRCVAAGTGCTLTENQKLAADTNNSSSITPFDATQILRYVAASRQTNATGEVGKWKFNPESRSYESVTKSIETENYEAILIGEINGNWAPASTHSFAQNDEEEKHEQESILVKAEDLTVIVAGDETVISQKQELESTTEVEKEEGTIAIAKKLDVEESDVQLSLPERVSAEKGTVISIPVLLNNTRSKEISSYSFAVRFDPTVFQPETTPVETMNSLSSYGFTLVSDTSRKGRIGIAASSLNNSVRSSGTLLFLSFRVVGTIKGSTVNALSALSIETAKKVGITFEDEFGNKFSSKVTNGVFSVTPSQNSESAKSRADY